MFWEVFQLWGFPNFPDKFSRTTNQAHVVIVVITTRFLRLLFFLRGELLAVAVILADTNLFPVHINNKSFGLVVAR